MGAVQPQLTESSAWLRGEERAGRRTQHPALGIQRPRHKEWSLSSRSWGKTLLKHVLQTDGRDGATSSREGVPQPSSQYGVPATTGQAFGKQAHETACPTGCAPLAVCRALPAPARPWVSSALRLSPQSKPHRGAGVQPTARNAAAWEPHLSPTPGSPPPTSPPFPPHPYAQSCQFGQIFRNLKFRHTLHFGKMKSLVLQLLKDLASHCKRQ